MKWLIGRLPLGALRQLLAPVGVKLLVALIAALLVGLGVVPHLEPETLAECLKL